MPIAERGNGYQVTVSKGGKRWRRQFATLPEAQLWEAQSKADLLAGGAPVLGDARRLDANLPKTLGDLVNYTYQNHWRHQKNGDGSRSAATAAAEVLGSSIPITKIDAYQVDRAILKLQDLGNSNGTINRKMACISKCLTLAIDLGVLASKPKIRKLPEKQGRIRWFSDQELQEMGRFFTDNGREDFTHWLYFQAETGLRTGETRKIHWSDLQDGHVILHDTKSGKPRGVPLSDRAREAVESMRHHPVGPFQWATPPRIRGWWDRLRSHMGWCDDREAVPHALRHTFCSKLIQLGVQIKVVQELAGHESIETTLRYAHLAPRNLQSAIDLLNKPTDPPLNLVA